MSRLKSEASTSWTWTISGGWIFIVHCHITMVKLLINSGTFYLLGIERLILFGERRKEGRKESMNDLPPSS
jgi:hypothetical protein